MKNRELKQVIKQHTLWLAGKGGACANLSHADLRRANLRRVDLSDAVGNMFEVKSMQFDRWQIVFTSDVMAIGCQQHSLSAWWNFTDEEISRMDHLALGWWGEWKSTIMAIIEKSPATPSGGKNE